jgi:hypothetical protein
VLKLICYNITNGRTAVIAVQRGFPEIHSVRQYCHIDIYDVTESLFSLNRLFLNISSNAAQQFAYSFTSILPVFSPLNRPIKASGVFSNP